MKNPWTEKSNGRCTYFIDKKLVKQSLSPKHADITLHVDVENLQYDLSLHLSAEDERLMSSYKSMG